MKKRVSKQVDVDKDDILNEYDFKKMTGGVRGKYYKAYRQGHTVNIYKSDGKTIVQYFTLKDGSVMLEPEIRKYFSDSETVNKVLRSLIKVVSNIPKGGISAKQRMAGKTK